MRRLAYLLPLALVFVLACQKQQTTTTKAPTPAWDLQLATDPAPPVEDQDTTFRIALKDAAGRPLPGATVTAALKMQTMDMGKNEVTFIDKGAGNYEGKGKFTMAGPWDVEVVAKLGEDMSMYKVPIVAHRKQ